MWKSADERDFTNENSLHQAPVGLVSKGGRRKCHSKGRGQLQGTGRRGKILEVEQRELKA